MEELGYRVLTAQNGREALSVLKRGEPIDLLFTDLVMPHGISGGELARRARQMRPELKILLGSGYSARISPDAAAREPADPRQTLSTGRTRRKAARGSRGGSQTGRGR